MHCANAGAAQWHCASTAEAVPNDTRPLRPALGRAGGAEPARATTSLGRVVGDRH